MVSTIHIDLKGGEFHFMTGSANLEERLCEPRGAPPEADLGLRSSILYCFLPWAERSSNAVQGLARNALQVLCMLPNGPYRYW